MAETRHNKYKPTEIKMTVKVSLNEWRKVHKMSAEAGIDASLFIRRLIEDATRECQLDIGDLEIIADRLNRNLGKVLEDKQGERDRDNH